MNLRTRSAAGFLCLTSCLALAEPTWAQEREFPRVGREKLAPEVLSLFAEDATQEGVVEVFLASAPVKGPIVPTATASFEADGQGGLRYTLNGRPVDASEVAAHADRTKRHLAARAVEQERQDAAQWAALLQQSGFADRVVGRSGGLAQLRLNAAELGHLMAVAGDKVLRVEAPKRTYDTLTNTLTGNPQGALETLGIIPWAHSYNLKGQGIGIWTGEGNAPDVNDSEINPAKVKFLTPEAPSVHSTWTTTFLQKAAPQATVYYGHQPVPCHLLSSILTQTNPPIYLGSHSWNWGDTTTGTYTGCCQAWDDFIYLNRVAMFVPSGGNMLGSYTTSPGKAFNVYATGAADTSVAGQWDIPWYSGYINPETGAIKPDGVTPGQCLTRKAGEACSSGVSLATPLAAGFAANLMSASPFFLNQPQAVKAYLVAGSTTNVVPGTAEDGPGMPNFLHTHFYRTGKWWNGSNTSYFNPVTQEIVEFQNLTAGKRYRIAISWLVTGTNALLNKRPSMQMELKVTKGTDSWISNYSRSVIQWVDFVAPSSGTYTITIKRTANDGGDLALALTVGEVV